MWYAVQVQTGSEEAMAELIARTVSPELLSECFYPRYETQTKFRGQRVTQVKPLFPGYVIADTSDAAALEAELASLPEFARVLGMDGTPVPLAAEEVQVIGAFTRPGERVVPMSRAVKEGEKVVVVDGPLLGHEALIAGIDRHKCMAYLDFDFCGRTISTRLGLAVLGSADAPESRAARLHAKVARA